ncbi:MAG: hypothetical protein K2Y71_14750 [Xanthobacteraceae bacterium]|nr:hypothetical protein [Xanthobacteraceae bacterium]
MLGVALHATFLIAGTALAMVCVARAWRLGRSGFDQDGNVRDNVAYNSVQLWGGMGIFIMAFVVIDLFYLFGPPAPQK